MSCYWHELFLPELLLLSCYWRELLLMSCYCWVVIGWNPREKTWLFQRISVAIGNWQLAIQRNGGTNVAIARVSLPQSISPPQSLKPSMIFILFSLF
jgi:hypothetical protein